MPLELTDADIIRKPRAGAMRSSAIELTDADVIRRKRPESRQVGSIALTDADIIRKPKASQPFVPSTLLKTSVKYGGPYGAALGAALTLGADQPKETGLGLQTGSAGLWESAAGGIEMFGTLLGSKELKDIAAGWREAAKSTLEALPAPEAGTLEEAAAKGKWAEWLAYNAGQLLPYGAATMATGIGVATAGAGAAGTALATGEVSYLLNAGEVYANMID